MPKSRAELNAAADARAQAAGFKSRSQLHRAGKVGYKGKGPQYNAAVTPKRAGIVSVRTSAGTVLSADLRRGQGPDLWAQLRSWPADSHVRVTIETNDGSVKSVGDKGGMKLSYLQAMHARNPDDRPGRGPGGARIITVTIT